MPVPQPKDRDETCEPSCGEANEIAAELETALRGILRLPLEAVIGARSPADLGLSSLGAITLQYRVQSLWGVDLSVSEILGAARIDELSALLRSRRAGSPAAAQSMSSRPSGVLI